RFLERDTNGHMTRHGKILASSFFNDREEYVTRRMVMDFDQIHTSALQQLNGRPAVLDGLHAHSERPISWRTIENRSRSENARSEHPARRGGFTHSQNEVQVGPHVADARDAV